MVWTASSAMPIWLRKTEVSKLVAVVMDSVASDRFRGLIL
jgi:hypothetical protein